MRKLFLLLVLLSTHSLAQTNPPWTIRGAQFTVDWVGQVCRGNDVTYCTAGANTKIDEYHVYSKRDGAFLYTINRNYAELIQQDFALALNEAEAHRPESKWIARQEAEISQLDYLLTACQSANVFCSGMASKLQKYQLFFQAACLGWSGVCIKNIQDEKTKRQKELDRIKAACAQGDEACWKAFFGEKETQAALQSQYEKTSGERPPHTPAGGWAPGRPVRLADGKWLDLSCSHCTITETDE